MPDMPWFIPLLIFFARICDVSIGTVRTILVMGGYRVTSALLGAVEVVIWVLAVGGAIRYLPHPAALVAYAGGFATGVLVGMTIEEKLALGYRLVRIITPRGGEAELIEAPEGTGGEGPDGEFAAPPPQRENVATALRRNGFRAIRIEGEGADHEPVWIVFCAVARRRLRELQAVVAEAAPNAFFTVERLDRAHDPGATPLESRFARRLPLRAFSVRK
jgi:hypothetical protein